MISHEIRNPLSAVMHCVEDIEDAIKEKASVNLDAIHEALETIDICISHQQHIVRAGEIIYVYAKAAANIAIFTGRRCSRVFKTRLCPAHLGATAMSTESTAQRFT